MYTIYHIPQIKIGCTQRTATERVHEQGYSDYEVLEVHTDIYVASDREIALQKEYGLPVDTKPYWQIVLMSNKNSSAKGGYTQGKNNVLYNIGIFSLSAQERLEVCKSGGLKGGKTNILTGHISNLGKQMVNIMNKEVVVCPICNMSGKTLGAMKRWHFDNCKSKK